jgi:serine/threonine protein kinase
MHLDTPNTPLNSPKSENRTSPGILQAGATLYTRYLIEEVIGIGGMGAVYRARDLHFPNVVKLVAVKEMINQARDPLVRETIVRNFEREANLLATLSHPAIPRIYDYFSHQERSYLILEFVQGKDLDAILNETADFLPEELVVRWGIELCEVLHYLHTHKPEPIIFRDMKPSNVMVDQHNHIVLVDFGIAKTFQTGERGTMIGTEGYSPPEQYRGEATIVADIYALGATLHHLLTRRDPRMEAPFSFGERPVRQINPRISPELESVLIIALQYDPANRYQSAVEMKEALLEVTRKTGILSPPPATLRSPALIKEIEPLWTFDCEDEIRGSATCDKGVVYFGSYDRQLYALTTTSGRLIWRYPADGGIVSKPAVIADQVCFGSEDYRLHVVSMRSGMVTWTYYTNGPVRSSPYCAHGHVFIGSDDGCLHAVNITAGRGAWKSDTGSAVRSSPLIGQEGLFFGNEAGEFFCLDFRGGIKWRFRAKRAITSSPVINGEFVLFSSLDASLYALEAKSGWAAWRFVMGKGSISTPCVAGDLVFLGAIDGFIYCVDLKSGKEVWKFPTEHQVTSSPIIYKDSLYCGSIDGHLYCLEYRTGQLRWKYQIGSPITATPTAYSDTIFIGSTNHRFYAFPSS